jgi:hypothetical protein
VAEPMPRRRFPCGECPWKIDAEPGRFPSSRYDDLRATSDQSGLDAPLFGCHKGDPGTNADLACAGWLAVDGDQHLGVRLAILSGRLPASALVPGEAWPALYSSYDEMAAANGAR